MSMTNNTGLNSITSWVIDLTDRKSIFHSEYSCRSDPAVVVISMSQHLHINDFMMFLFVMSYLGRVTLEIIIKTCGLTIEVVTL